MLNPLFPSDDDAPAKREPVRAQPRSVAHHTSRRVEPVHDLSAQRDDGNVAANLIRQKIDTLYGKEPNAREEIREVKHEVDPFSKHQKFMMELSKSGKGLAEIQTAWHNYYVALPDEEKHEVWREFYEHNGKNSHFQQYAAHHQKSEDGSEHKAQAAEKPPEKHETKHPAATHHAVNPSDGNIVVSQHELQYEDMAPHHNAASVKRQILRHVNAGGNLKARHHVQSLLFGLAVGCVVLVIVLFSFFNEYFIAPFIQPSRTASATPLIVGANDVAPTSTPEVIIPKINVEIPLNFSVSSTDETEIENALEDGVVHYPTTVLPGQKGNTAFFGHSSNNIFNPGKYKFAFALLHDLVPGDTFYLSYGNKLYQYQVFQKQIVDPGDVSVLDNVPNYTATATLITCDPPGTSLHRLVVWGTQVSPNPNTNTAGNNTSAGITGGTELPSNGPSLWDRMIHSLFGWL